MSSGDLVVSLVRTSLNYQQEAELPECDWSEVQQICQRHRVAPLLCAMQSSLLPSPFVNWLKDSRLMATSKSLALRSSIARISDRFEKLGVQALLFKGLALQDYLYARHCRVVGDIDLVVDRAALQVARQELNLVGFKATQEPSHSPQSVAGVLVSPEGWQVDLHAAPIEPYFCCGPSFKELWSAKVQLETLALPTISLPIHFILLLLHGVKHHWCHLILLVDIALAAQKMTEVDWQLVEELAARFKIKRIMLVGLKLCEAVLRPPVVAWEVILRGATSHEVALVSLYQRRLFRQIPDTPRVKLANALLHLRCMTDIQRQARYITIRSLHVLEGFRRD